MTGRIDGALSGRSWTSTFNTVTVFVDAPTQTVWHRFHDRGAWMPSFIGSETVRGSLGEAGWLGRVVGMHDGVSFERWEEVLYVKPHERFVVRLWSEATTLRAHADFRFDGDDHACHLTVSIHSWIPPEAGFDAALLATATQAKISDDVRRLKAIAEGVT